MRRILAAAALAAGLAVAGCGHAASPMPVANAAFCAQSHSAIVADVENGGPDLNALSGQLSLDVTSAASYYLGTGPATTMGNDATFRFVMGKVFSDCR